MGENVYGRTDVHRMDDEGIAHREHHDDEGEACHEIDAGHLAANIQLMHEGDAEGQAEKRHGIGLESAFRKFRRHSVELAERTIGKVGCECRIRRRGH